MRSFILAITFLFVFTSALLAQHSLQLDYGGAYSTIMGSSPGGTYTLPPGGGTIFVIQPGPSPFWRTDGNSGTTAGTNFLGTTDNVALHLNVKNAAVINNNLTLGATGSLYRDVTTYGAGNARGNFAIDLQAERTGATQVASGDHALILGGRRNTSSGSYSLVVGGETNNAGYAHDVIVGGNLNSIADAGYGFIGGGSNNEIYDDYSIIVGGDNNRAGDNAGTTLDKMYATVVGGRGNVASGAGSFIGGGGFDGSLVGFNLASGGGSVVVGGRRNDATNTYAFIGGGTLNKASGIASFVGGGGYDGETLSGNTASGTGSSVVGGMGNTASGTGSFVAGGGSAFGLVFGNTASGESASVLSGEGNTASGDNSVVLAGENCEAKGHGSIIAGHASTAEGTSSTVLGWYSHAYGGKELVIGSNNVSSVTAGLGIVFGAFNQTDGSSSLLGGFQSSAVGNYTFVLGEHCRAGGNNAMGFGAWSWANADYSMATGYAAIADKFGQSVRSSGWLVESGDAQASSYILRNKTTDATPTDLFLDGASLRLTLATNSTYTFTGIITARSTTGTSDGWKIEGTIQNNGGTYTLVYSSVTNIGTNSWSIALNTTGNSLNIAATGAAATDIGWVARIETAEVIY